MAYSKSEKKAQRKHPSSHGLGAAFPQNPRGVQGTSQASGGARIPTGPSEFASNPGVGTGGR